MRPIIERPGMDDAKAMRNLLIRGLYSGAIREATKQGVDLEIVSAANLRIFSVDMMTAATVIGWPMGTMTFVAESLESRGLIQLFDHGQRLMALTPDGVEYARQL